LSAAGRMPVVTTLPMLRHYQPFVDPRKTLIRSNGKEFGECLWEYMVEWFDSTPGSQPGISHDPSSPFRRPVANADGTTSFEGRGRGFESRRLHSPGNEGDFNGAVAQLDRARNVSPNLVATLDFAAAPPDRGAAASEIPETTDSSRRMPEELHVTRRLRVQIPPPSAPRKGTDGVAQPGRASDRFSNDCRHELGIDG
jgi:hypothetical protein